MSADNVIALKANAFFFLKGGEDVLKSRDGVAFDWNGAATKVREHLTDALNAKNVSFLFGSGCSSYLQSEPTIEELGIPTMGPLAKDFLRGEWSESNRQFLTNEERNQLQGVLGIDVFDKEFSNNLERLMEVLYSIEFVLKRSSSPQLCECIKTVESAIQKISKYILNRCTKGRFSEGDATVLNLYQAFYRKLVYRDRNLPKPWVFTTNYDLFNETAMDRLGIQYSNGFSGTIERRFNPATYRYALAEQLDVASRKWTSVDSYLYLCKLHGSVGWVEDGISLFPIREINPDWMRGESRVMIYPTPAKQSASFGYPYADLFREFQARIVREQSVLFILGYSFGDEHINNIIFQALTIPTFRLIAFLPPNLSPVAKKVKDLRDPRVWLIGGNGSSEKRKAHYLDTFVESFMPEPPGDKVDVAIDKVLSELLSRAENSKSKDIANDNG